MGGAREWSENEATSLQTFSAVASFPGHVGGARKWPEKLGSGLEKRNSHKLAVKVVNLWYVLGRPPCMSNCSVKKM